MDFETLLSRLTALLRLKMKAGEFTERNLARLAGISQPHVHHILNGVRALTPATADLLLQAMQGDVTELLETAELTRSLERRPVNGRSIREIPMLAESLGPGSHWPLTESRERIALPRDALDGLHKPVGARLAHDPRMASVLRAGDVVVLECSEERLRRPDPRDLHVVEWRGEALVRWVRHGARLLYIAAADTLDRPELWETECFRARAMSEIVKARVLPPTREDGGAASHGVRRHPGKSQASGRRCVAN